MAPAIRFIVSAGDAGLVTLPQELVDARLKSHAGLQRAILQTEMQVGATRAGSRHSRAECGRDARKTAFSSRAVMLRWFSSMIASWSSIVSLTM